MRDILQDYELFCIKEDNTVYRFSPLFFFLNVRILSASVSNGVRFKMESCLLFMRPLLASEQHTVRFLCSYTLVWKMLKTIVNIKLMKCVNAYNGSCSTLESRA